MPPCEKHETGMSQRSLPAVLSEASEPVCLLGGWAVHAAVNSGYRLATGRDYIGSRDICLGFHFEGGEDAEAVRSSALAGTVRSLGRIGYEGAASRMVRYYGRDSRRRPLTKEEASKTPLRDMFCMCVDLMVDNVPPGAGGALGFVPAAERMIGHALVGGRSDEIDEFGARILLPRPEVLLAAKILSMPRLPDGRRRWKDVADMYALVWHSGTKIGELRPAVAGLVPQGRLSKALGAITGGDYGEAAGALEADASHVKAVLEGFLGGGKAGEDGTGRAGGGGVSRNGRAAGVGWTEGDPPVHSAGGGRKGGGGPWPTPYALGYGRFAALVRALGERAGAGREAELRDIAAAASVGEHNAAMNLSFLESVGVARRSVSGSYGLTEAGARYAGAHMSGRPDRIKKESRAVVRGSHLRQLADEARAGAGMRRGELLRRIKELAGRPDGPGAGNMQWPASTGAGTLLRMLGDAGMLPGGAPS